MAVEVKVTDNTDKVMQIMKGNVEKALTAMGQLAVEMTVDQMNTGYGKPIYKTGDLQRSITFETDVADQTVTIGTDITYGIYVHEGTSKMAARPFLKDAIMNNMDMLQETAANELKKDF